VRSYAGLFFGRCMLGLEIKLAAPLFLRGIAGLQEGRGGVCVLDGRLSRRRWPKQLISSCSTMVVMVKPACNAVNWLGQPIKNAKTRQFKSTGSYGLVNT
jgi:hypothetical protein